MSNPVPGGRPGTRWAGTAVRITGGLLGGAATILLVLLLNVIVNALVDPRNDPHGYSVIFGFLGVMVVGVPAALLLPLAWPARLRARAYLIALLLYLTATVGTFAIMALLG